MTSRLQLGIDFSTKFADVCLLDGAGQRLVSHQRFTNSLPGYQDLKQLLLESLSAQANASLDISGEATGMYWLPFFLQLARDPELAAYGTQLYLLNPRWVAWYKKCFAPRDKSDAQDAYYIADHQRLHPTTHPWEPHLATLALRTYTRFRFHLVQDLAREKSFYCAYLFLKANAYQHLQPFSDVFGATSRLVLGQTVSLDELAALPVHDLASKLSEMSHGRLRDPLRNATRLHRVARESFPLPAALALPVQRILDTTLELIAALEARITAVEGWISAELEAFPAIRQLATVPGIGPVCSAGVGAEILPLERFLTAPKWDARRGRYRPRNLRDVEDAVAKQAGLWWPRAQSGDFEAEERHMSKAGNAYLRYYLIQGADQLRKYEPLYRRYYQP